MAVNTELLRSALLLFAELVDKHVQKVVDRIEVIEKALDRALSIECKMQAEKIVHSTVSALILVKQYKAASRIQSAWRRFVQTRPSAILAGAARPQNFSGEVRLSVAEAGVAVSKPSAITVSSGGDIALQPVSSVLLGQQTRRGCSWVQRLWPASANAVGIPLS